MKKRSLKQPIEKLKPWGREIWFAWTPQYAGKILEIKKGHRFSLQYHERKSETQLVIEGKLEYCVSEPGAARKGLEPQGNKESSKRKKQDFLLKQKILLAGDKIDFLPYTIHRARALENSIIFEVSTPELDDVVKLDDDYGRKGKGNNEKLDKKLAALARR